MKRIAVSCDDDRGLDGVVAPHFGRCPYYTFVDVEGRQVLDVKVVSNPFYNQHAPGQVPAFIREHGAHVMLSGGMGSRAMAFFEQFGIEAVTGASGTVRHALERYLEGELVGAVPCRESVGHGHGNVAAEGPYERDEVGRLREEADDLRRQLDEVMRRLNNLER